MSLSPDQAKYEEYLEALRQMRNEDLIYPKGDDKFGKNFPESRPFHLEPALWGYEAVTPTIGPRRDWSRNK